MDVDNYDNITSTRDRLEELTLRETWFNKDVDILFGKFYGITRILA